MSENIIYRHNVMNINSVEAFLGIRGGFNKGLRDVYFVRMTGVMPGIDTKIVEIDKRMDIETINNRLYYKRIKQLPGLQNPADMQFYSEQLQEWKINRTISLRNNQEGLFTKTLGNALSAIVADYKRIKPSATESMEKNLEVKLLFWIDSILGDALGNWDERRCIKVVAENVVKEQEYLFYYMLTLVGCDVLLMQCSRDIEIVPELKNKSLNLNVGSFGDINLPEYIRYTKEQSKAAPEAEPVSAQTVSPAMKPVNITHPGRTSVRKETEISAKPTAGAGGKYAGDSVSRNQEDNMARRTVVNTNAGRPKESTEKSFEDLALLASSVVMITVLNRRGEPEATGSGIMIGKEGYILTNNHVVENGCFYEVQIEGDNNVYTADGVIKTNRLLDMAVIRINKKLKPIPIYNGKNKLVRGQKVVAIGSPLGLFNSVSDGIISGFRTINNVDMIQFTAPISHGSSGGAVLNMQGEIIGISTAGIDKGQNINLAVSYEDILIFSRGFY